MDEFIKILSFICVLIFIFSILISLQCTREEIINYRDKWITCECKASTNETLCRELRYREIDP